MLNPAHVLETAFLLLVAFLIGAVIGSLARLAALRLAPSKATPVVSAPAASVAAEGPALVAAPVIEPMTRPAQPTAPTEVPVPDFSEVALPAEVPAPAPGPVLSEVRMPKLQALPPVETKRPSMAPARKAGKTTSGREVPRPLDDAAARPPVAASNGPSAEIIPFPGEPGTPVTPTPTPAEAVVTPAIEFPAASESAEPVEPVAAELVAPVAEAGTPPAAAATPVSEPAVEDETAAMRAIEGNWVPRRAEGRRHKKVEAPEGMVEEPAEVVAGPAEAEQPGRPVGIAAPRGGVKDNLTNVIGILPIIETSLNGMGVYHFDQVGAFSDENVAWLEAHLGIAGRIDREHWREQARELAVISERARKVAGQT